jgi:hypothetical protein
MHSGSLASQHGRRSAGRGVAIRTPRNRRRTPRTTSVSLHHTLAVGAAAIALVAGISIAPAEHAAAVAPAAPSRTVGSQALAVDSTVVAPSLTREAVTATDGVQTLSSNGTNEDWAKLVLLDGGWPQTEANVTFMLRWMRQENGPPDWWNRNNPLNNGYGSGGGAGLGSYPDLETAAMYAALNLQRGYPDVVAGLVDGTSADVTAQAIWASPWASSHYGNGTHWSTTPVEIVKAPESAW